MSEHKTREDEPRTESGKPTIGDRIVTVQRKAIIDGREIAYTVSTGTMILSEETEGKGEKEGEAQGEKARAEIFFVAYTLDGVEDPGSRAITFSFNGGPGSSSVWLHLGALGPRRAVLEADGALPSPPFLLEDNAHSILDMTDLVFIDPVSTGFSRALPGEKSKDFLGFTKDIESVGDFIRLYASRNGRWLSPKFLAGESYGTMRSAGLSGYLQDRHGLYLNGILLISSILDYGTVEAHPGNDLPYILYLPSYTATAWYHGKLSPELQADLAATLREAEAFASGDYAVALLKGAALTAAERTAIAHKLAHFTGLSAEYIERVDLRIEIMRFTKELLRDRGRSAGRLDSRFTGIDRDSGGENFEFDPSMAAIKGPYSAALNDYVRRELGYESDRTYEIFNPKTLKEWSYAEHQNHYVQAAETLRRAMSENPHLKVFVASGYYDLATPYFATIYSLSHLGLDPALQENLSMSYYEAGHMMYIHEPSLAALKKDMAAFLVKSGCAGKAKP